MARHKHSPVTLGALKRSKVVKASLQPVLARTDVAPQIPQSQTSHQRRSSSSGSADITTPPAALDPARSNAASSSSSRDSNVSTSTADTSHADQIDVHVHADFVDGAANVRLDREKSTGHVRERPGIQSNVDNDNDDDDDVDDDDDLDHPTSAQRERGRQKRLRPQQRKQRPQIRPHPQKALGGSGPLRGLSVKNILPTPSSLSCEVDDDSRESEKSAFSELHQRSKLDQFEATRHDTRSARNGRSDANYDMKYHPMDRVTRPKRTAKRLLASRPHSKSISGTESDEVSEHYRSDLPSSDDETGSSDADASLPEERAPKRRKPDPMASRRSDRASNARFVDYNIKHHPQDHLLPGRGRQPAGVLSPNLKRGRPKSASKQDSPKKKRKMAEKRKASSTKIDGRTPSKKQTKKRPREHDSSVDELVELAIKGSRARSPNPDIDDISSDERSVTIDLDVDELVDSAVEGATLMHRRLDETDSGWLERSSNDFLREMDSSQRTDVDFFHSGDEPGALGSAEYDRAVTDGAGHDSGAFDDAMLSIETKTTPGSSADDPIVSADPRALLSADSGSREIVAEREAANAASHMNVDGDDDENIEDDDQPPVDGDEHDDDDDDDEVFYDTEQDNYDMAVAAQMRADREAPSTIATFSPSSLTARHFEVIPEIHGGVSAIDIVLSPADTHVSLMPSSWAPADGRLGSVDSISKVPVAKQRQHQNATPPSGQVEAATGGLRVGSIDLPAARPMQVPALNTSIRRNRSEPDDEQMAPVAKVEPQSPLGPLTLEEMNSSFYG